MRKGASIGNGSSGPTGLIKVMGASYADAKAMSTTSWNL
jgi:hypothetical protein